MTAPIDLLVEPASHDPVPDVVENIIGSTQYVSASYWAGQVLNVLHLFNPWQFFSDEYAGDWRAVQSAGIALQHLGSFDTACAGAIASAADTMAADWDGRAAAAADGYFDGLTAAIAEQAPDLGAVGREFEQLAAGMYEAANGIKGLLELFSDLLLALGLDMAAAATVGWTGVGAVVTGALAAATITKTLGVWGDMMKMHGYVWTAVQGAIGVIAGYLSALEDLEQHALPAAYDHPGA